MGPARLEGRCSLCYNVLAAASPGKITNEDIPSMTDADDMIHITQGKLEKLVRQYASRISKSKETVVRKNRPQSHSPRMQYGLMAQTTQAGVSMYDSNALANNNIAEDGKEGEDGGEGGLAVDNPEWDVVDLETVGKISDAFPTVVRMCDDDDLVSTIYEFLVVLGMYRWGMLSRLALDNWYI